MGIFYWPDGRIYEGQWKDGKQHGYGRYSNHLSEEKYGYWSNGKREYWLTNEQYEQARREGHFG